jgi:hypothetical protein
MTSGISFWLDDRHFCFVNSHLAAHQQHFELRNSNFKEICEGLRFADKDLEITSKFHYLFWYLSILNS